MLWILLVHSDAFCIFVNYANRVVVVGLRFVRFLWPQMHIAYILESVQDFLIKLGIKPLMHLLEISMYFFTKKCHVRLTKIMKRADKNWAHFK